MQASLPFGQTEDLRSIRDHLLLQFGKIPDGERLDPTSQFICSFLGSRTYDQKSWDAFVKLIRHFHTLDKVADSPESEIETVIRDVTYPEKKAPDLKRALRKIRARYGAINLDFLDGWETEQALYELEQIHGVGRKISAATLNFSSLRGRAFVVDTHVLRILRRFGFVDANAVTESAYDAVMEVADDFDADGLRELHWHLKSLGQKTCSHARALCVSCPLSGICRHRVEEGALMITRASACVA